MLGTLHYVEFNKVEGMRKLSNQD